VDATAARVITHERAAQVARMLPAEWMKHAGATPIAASVAVRRLESLEPTDIERLKALRAHQPEAALAAAIGISRSTLARAMLGEALYTPTRSAIVRHLGLPQTAMSTCSGPGQGSGSAQPKDL